MTIRLAMTAPIETGREEQGIVVYDDRGFTIAECDTREEAEQAKRAFELVLAPRFTRDEVIAIVKAALAVDETPGVSCTHDLHAGIRLALKALAAAGAFSDARHELVWVSDCGATEPYNPDDCDNAYSVGDREECIECDSPVERACQARLVVQTMADLLDAAGIR